LINTTKPTMPIGDRSKGRWICSIEDNQCNLCVAIISGG
jgi:hypothetical protein